MSESLFTCEGCGQTIGAQWRHDSRPAICVLCHALEAEWLAIEREDGSA